MVDPNSQKAYDAFARCFEIAAEKIREYEPDVIIAPMRGAVPFIDVLHIIDESFPLDKVEYVSASSVVHRRKEVLKGSFRNIIKASDAGEQTKFLSLDEVISGNSAAIVSKQFDAARWEYANDKARDSLGSPEQWKSIGSDDPGFKRAIEQHRAETIERMPYVTIGIVDKEKRDTIPEDRRTPAYQRMLEKGIVIPIETPSILSMDKIGFFPANYREGTDGEGKPVHLPVVESFHAGPRYLDFLKRIASIVGKDPAKISPCNVGKITDSYKWVPEELRTL